MFWSRYCSKTGSVDLSLALESEPTYRHSPVITFSAYFNRSESGNPGGFDGILYKPFDLDKVMNMVHTHI